MSHTRSHTISVCLIGTGVAVWALAGKPLTSNPDLKVPLNPLGINRSPYGEVFAMAMQTPIDSYFHGALGNAGHHHENGDECASCKEADEKKAQLKNASGTRGLPGKFENLLASLEKASETRTNPKAATQAHKLYLRRQVEDKLRFAYELDPSHYANYNSLHFFLTEPELGTRPQLTPSAAKLADDTIRYCLNQENDPRPALTAAAAATNILELMFNDHQSGSPKFTTAQMRQYLALLDHCLARYVSLAKQWDSTGNWKLLSPQRIAECDERFTFISKIRETDLQTIERFEAMTSQRQATN